MQKATTQPANTAAAATTVHLCRRARATRLLAAGILIFCVLAALGVLRLGFAEWRFRQGELPAWAGSAAYFEGQAQRTPAGAREALRSAVAANPRASSAWISLGLAAEDAGDAAGAARDFAAAAQVDQLYLPAWSAANFFFRRGDAARFWPAAARAAALAPGDLAPLLDLADRMEPDAPAAVARLAPAGLTEATRPLERAYLDFLIGKQRWDSAQSLAWRIEAHQDPGDAARLLDLVDRLLAAGRGDAALALCTRMRSRPIKDCPAPDPGSASVLTNGNLAIAASGHGFDWRLPASPGVRVEWHSGQLEFRLPASGPASYVLLEQPVRLSPRRYRLRFAYRIEGAALTWVADQAGLGEQTSPPYTGASHEGESARQWSQAEWRFAASRTGLARLRLVCRQPGAARLTGAVAMAGAAGARDVSLAVLSLAVLSLEVL